MYIIAKLPLEARSGGFSANRGLWRDESCQMTRSLSQYEAMLPWEAARVIATPQDQVVGLGDHHQLIRFLHRSFRDSDRKQSPDFSSAEI